MVVINDMNDVSKIRNTIGTIKYTLNFFPDSPLKRKYASNIPLLCEIHWTEKYKSIRLFKKNIN